ncbi:OmpW family protein [Psychroserpens sp. XS_ASV72]|uniref:OmpW/AlkL family protein n=1 Tax=Psychroserpens sp. XS_ASV72 TaxID=3241293 RepID=UPI003516A3A6
MKKVFLFVLLVSLFAVDGQAQVVKAEYEWQARVRAVYVAPAPYFYRSISNVEVNISETVAPEIGLSYFLSKKMSADLTVSMSTHDVEVEGGSNLGSISLLSPTLALQHHFYANNFKPYIGAGINYTSFFNEDPGDLDSIEYKNQVGYVLQAGIDYKISDKWFINLDFRKMYLKTEVTGNNDSDNSSEVNVDPLILGFGVGMKF